MKKTISYIVIIIIVLAAGYWLFGRKEALAPVEENPNYQQTGNQPSPATTSSQPSTPTTGNQVKTNPNATDYTPPTSPTGGENVGSNIQVTEVDFDGSQFLPATVNISVNDYVFFKNKSSKDFWPIAGSANTQSAYPNFSAGKPVPPGGEFKFQFTKAGSFSYGDNLNAGMVGTINVK